MKERLKCAVLWSGITLLVPLLLVSPRVSASPIATPTPEGYQQTVNARYQTLMATFHEMFISSTPTPSTTPIPPTKTITPTPTIFTPYPIYTVPAYPGPTFNPYPGPTFEVISEPALFQRMFLPLINNP